jgi:hypothetical protein
MSEKQIKRVTLRDAQCLRVRMNAYPVPVAEGESAIYSLTIGGDGRVYGATSGRNCHVFSFCNILGKTITLIGRIPGPASIHNALMVDEGNIYVGVNSTNAAGTIQGALYSMRIHPEISFVEEALGETLFKVDEPLTLMVTPKEGEVLRAVVYHKASQSIIGVTMPDANLFKYDIKKRKLSIIKNISSGSSIVARYKGRLVSKTLVVADDGNIYGTGENGLFFKYNPKDDEVAYLECSVPGMLVRRGVNSAECFCKDETGNIYGGTTDGFLFRLSLDSHRVINFGKPSLERPINAIVWKNGLIYGVCGGERGIAHVFSYNLACSHFEDLGMINYIPCEGGPFDTGKSSPWSAWKVATMIKDTYGTIYLGENDSKGHLFTLFI